MNKDALPSLTSPRLYGPVLLTDAHRRVPLWHPRALAQPPHTTEKDGDVEDNEVDFAATSDQGGCRKRRLRPRERTRRRFERGGRLEPLISRTRGRGVGRALFVLPTRQHLSSFKNSIILYLRKSENSVKKRTPTCAGRGMYYLRLFEVHTPH